MGETRFAAITLLVCTIGAGTDYLIERQSTTLPSLDGLMFSERGEQRVVDHGYYKRDGSLGLVTYHTPTGRGWATGDEWREWVR